MPASTLVMAALPSTDHRPYPLQPGQWRLAQRWNDLLFAHWPIPAEALAGRLPAGLEPDLYNGLAWLGVVPFFMDRVRVRVAGEHTLSVPGTRSFPELNLRTYVRSRRSGRQGVYFFSLDAGSLLAVLGARTLFHLPYFPARMRYEVSAGDAVVYSSRRSFPRSRPAEVRVRYGAAGPVKLSERGDLADFLTERYCLFTTSARGRLLVGEIHHRQWPLQPADAEFERNNLAADFGFSLPATPPVLHFAKELEVYLWSLRCEADG